MQCGQLNQGATVRIILFTTLAIELKRQAPNAHTSLEVIHARYGTPVRVVFIVFCEFWPRPDWWFFPGQMSRLALNQFSDNSNNKVPQIIINCITYNSREGSVWLRGLDHTESIVINLRIFCKMYQIQLFLNQASDMLQEILWRNSTAITPGIIARIYENTPDGSFLQDSFSLRPWSTRRGLDNDGGRWSINSKTAH